MNPTILHTTNTPPPARHYHSDLSLWLSVDPMANKYPGVSPYTYCGDNPVRLVDPDGRTIVDPNGEVCYTEQDGWLPNAPEDTKRIGNALLQTRTGQEQFHKMVRSDIYVSLHISQDEKFYMGGRLNGVTFHILEPDQEGNVSTLDNRASITIYEGSIKAFMDCSSSPNQFSTKTIAALCAPNVTLDQFIAAIAGHEIEHAISPDNWRYSFSNNLVLREAAPDRILDAILMESMMMNIKSN